MAIKSLSQYVVPPEDPALVKTSKSPVPSQPLQSSVRVTGTPINNLSDTTSTSLTNVTSTTTFNADKTLYVTNISQNYESQYLELNEISNYVTGGVVSVNGISGTVNITGGLNISVATSGEDIIVSASAGVSGISGYSGISGFSGESGFSGFSGSGKSGFSGWSGFSGISIPTGGTTGQSLVKNSNTNYDVEWATVGGVTSLNSLTGALSIAGGTGTSVGVSGTNVTINNVYETISIITNATGVVTHDFSTSSIFYHSSILNNFTVNIINLNLSHGFATNIVLILNQGAGAYIPNSLQIGGVAQSINWQGGTVPTGNSLKKDLVSFSITNISGTYIVLGQLVTFG